LLHYQDNTAVIVGLLENDVDEVANLLKDSLKQFGRTSLNYLCKEDAANFFCKFLSKDPKCPSPISITKIGVGIQLEGPPSIARKGHACSFCCTNCFFTAASCFASSTHCKVVSLTHHSVSSAIGFI